VYLTTHSPVSLLSPFLFQSLKGLMKSYINPLVNVDCVKTLGIGWMTNVDTKNGRRDII
jgi:hypothetical protein